MIDECVGLIQLDEQERLSHIDGARLDSGYFFRAKTGKALCYVYHTTNAS